MYDNMIVIVVLDFFNKVWKIIFGTMLTWKKLVLSECMVCP
jgi:hypothetical protein